jgi:hypothetical protein
MQYIGQDIAITVTRSVCRHISCESCGRGYSFIDEKTVMRAAHSAYMLDNEGAARVAREDAEREADRLLASEIGPVPCPHCGWYQRAMIQTLRLARYTWVPRAVWVLALASFFVGVAIELIAKEFRGFDWLQEGGLVIGTGATLVAALCLLAARPLLRSIYNPNRSVPQETRIEIGQQFALAPEQATPGTTTAGTIPDAFPIAAKLPTPNLTPLPPNCHDLVGLSLAVVFSELSARVTGTAWKPTVCRGCGEKYYYRMTRATTGARDANVTMSQEEGQRAAQATAEQRLWDVLAEDFNLIPCPTCGKYQPEMCEELRERKCKPAWTRTLILGAITGLSLTLSGWCLTPEFQALGLDRGLIPLLILGGLAGVLTLVSRYSYQVQKRGYNPNEEPLEQRLKIAKQRSLTADELLRRWGSRHNADPSPEVLKPWKGSAQDTKPSVSP